MKKPILDTYSGEYLYRGLPCINVSEDKYIVYSPYKSQIVEIDAEDLFRDELKEMDLFGTPERIKEEPYISDLGLIVTFDCNLRCIYCFAYGGEMKVRMPEKIVLAAINHVISDQTAYLNLEFTGGEPTCNFEAIKCAVEEVEKTGLTPFYKIGTGGVMGENQLDYLITNNFIFHVSCDGPPQIHNITRPFASGEGSYSYVEKTIKKLVKEDATFKVRTTVTKYSVKFMADIINHFADLGVKYVHFESLDLWGRAARARLDLCDVDSFIDNFDRALDAGRERGVKITHDVLANFTKPAINACPSISGKKMLVLPDGKVTMCYNVLEQTNPLADLLIVGEYNPQTNSFEMDKKKRNIICNHSVDKVKGCANCFVKYLCSGNCLNRHLVNTRSKDLQSLDPYQCEMTKALFKHVILRLWRYSKGESLTARTGFLP